VSRIADAVGVLVGTKALPEGAPAPDLYGARTAPGRRISNLRAERHTEAYGGQDAIDHVMNCVAMYANPAAHAAYYFERNGKRLVDNPRSPDYKGLGYSTAPPDLVELFKYPNRNSDYTELIELSIIDYLLAGEFIWLMNKVNGLGQPQEVYRVPPHLVEVIPGRVSPQGYIYNVPSGEPLRYRADEVVHVKRANPHDPWRGLGVISGNPAMYDISLSLDASIRSYYEQGTKLSGVLETDRSLPASTWEKLKAEFSNLYAGGPNAYQVAFTERGLKFQPISADANQGQFGPSQDQVRDRIAGAFHVPTPLLGDVGGSTDRQAVREAQRIFDNRQLRPFLDTFQARISNQLVRAWDLDYCIEYEYTMPIEDKLDLAGTMAGVPGVTVRELRGQMDLPPLESLGIEQGKEIDETVLGVPGFGAAAAVPAAPGEPGQPGRPGIPEGATGPPGSNPDYDPDAEAAKAFAGYDPAVTLRRMMHQMRKQINGAA
jgi:HK97 family phage portal protein